MSRGVTEETPKAAHALQVYLQLGPQRSLQAVSDAIGHRSMRHVARWSSAYGWSEKARQHDAHMREVYQRKAETALEELAERHAQIAKAGLAIAARKLQALARDAEAKEVSVRDAIRLVEACSKLERLALGEATDRHEVKAEVKQEEPEIPFRDLMRDPETRALLDALAKAQDG